MKTITLLIILIALSYFAVGQNNESIYALNEGVTNNRIKQGEKINWGELTPFPGKSYVTIKEKPNSMYYFRTDVNGQFAYGHYFKYQTKVGNEYKYVRTDGREIEYLLVNYPLSKLAESNQYDEHIVLKLINYRTSFGIMFKF